MFKQLEIEPVNVNYVYEKNISVHVAFIDSLGLMVVQRTVENLAIELPIVMERSTYESELHQIHSNESFQAAVQRYHSTGSARTGESFKFGTNIKNKTIERIFGSSEVSISINGSIDVSVSGKTKKQEGVASSLQQENEGAFSPKLDLRQQFYLEGKIGDKLTISAQQNSESDFDIENQIKVKYQGYEDEVIQSIEAGNISVNLPGSSLITSTETHQGLFGLKTHLQFGNLNFTGVASVIEGEKKKQSFNPAGNRAAGASDSETETTLKDFQFEKYRFFFVDTIFRNKFERYNDISEFPNKNIELENAGIIQRLDVYLSTDNNDHVTERRFATAIVNKDAISQVDSTNTKEGVYETLKYKLLKPNIDYGYNPDLGYFYLKRKHENKTIAISYNVIYANSSHSDNNNYWLSEGDFNTFEQESVYEDFRDNNPKTEKYLKLIKSKNQTESNNRATNYLQLEKLHMQNVYRFNYLPNENLTVKIYENDETKTSPSTPDAFTELNFLSIFGLDRLNESGEVANSHRGDGEIDILNKLLFEPRAKPQFLIFPSLTPFQPSAEAKKAMELIELRSGNNFAWPTDYESNGIYSYSTTVTEARYYIQIDGDATGIADDGTSGSNLFKLNDFNIIEGSERLTANGVVLKRGQDYDINYFSGEIYLKSSRAILNKNSLEVEYEAPNLFQLDKKTLLGGQLDYTFENGYLGARALYLKKSSLDDKVRLGNEPFENFAWGLSGKLEGTSSAVSQAAQFLPSVSPTAESKFSIEMQYAQLIPNPNTRSNSKTGDNSGVAYIDDFEAAKRTNGFSMLRQSWVPSSIPRIVNGETYINNTELDTGRAQLAFFNPFIPYRSTYILDKNTSRNVTDDLRILNLAIRKETKIYDGNNDEVIVEDQAGFVPVRPKTPKTNAWAGVMASNRHNSDLNNSRFLEIWVRWDYPEKNGVLPKLNIDFGQISEDYYTKPQVLDGLASFINDAGQDHSTQIVSGRDAESSEDIAGFFADNILQAEEDVGLDRMTDDEERAVYGIANPFDNWQPMKQDAKGRYFAGHDDAVFDAEHDLLDEFKAILPWRINGTQGNSAESTTNLYPDNEDLDKNGAFDNADKYFHAEIPMYTHDGDLQNHPYFSAFGKEAQLGWVQFRIPIRELLESGSYYSQDGSPPPLTNANYIRLYVDDFDELDDDDVILLNMASLEFVGTDWQTISPKALDDINVTNNEIGTESDEIGIRFLNSDENQHTLDPADNFANYYVSPAGVEGDYVDAERTTRGKEQAMVIDIDDLEAGYRAEVRKSGNYIAKKFSLHNYKELKMFMRAHLLDINEENPSYSLPTTRDEFRQSGSHRNYFYIKFGTNSDNFYEYRVPVIGNKLPDQYTEPSASNKAIQRAYWADTQIKIDLDLLAATKQRGYVERFGGKYTGSYLYEDVADTLMERYRVVGNPNINNLQFLTLGVYNADHLSGGSRKLKTQIWVNELRASDVRKDLATAMNMRLTGNISDFARFSAYFDNRDANFRTISQTTSGSQTTSESQQFSLSFELDKLLPKGSGFKLPLSLSSNTSYAIPKFVPGSDAQTFYSSGSGFDRLKHLLGFGSFSSDIKRIYGYSNTEKIGFSFSKSRTNDSWYNRWIVDNVTYTGDITETVTSNNTYQNNDKTKYTHNFGYKYSFTKENYVSPFSWVGDISWLPRLAGVRLYYSPTTFGGLFKLTQDEGQLKKWDELADDPTFKANSTRSVNVGYNLTDEITSTITRSYTSDISSIRENGKQMTITDAFVNALTNPFKKDAVGNDYDVKNTVKIGFSPRLVDGLTTKFDYTSAYSYKEELLKDNSVQGNSRTYKYTAGFYPKNVFSKLFGTKDKKESTAETDGKKRSRGRGGSSKPKSKPVKKKNKFSEFEPAYFYQDPPKNNALKLNLEYLNPLVWIESFLTSWEKVDVTYGITEKLSHGRLNKSQAGFKYQFGFTDNIGVASLDSLQRFGRSDESKIDVKNKFKFGPISVDLDNSSKHSESLQNFGNVNYSKEYTYFTLGDEFDKYHTFRRADSLNGVRPIGVLVPNWSVTIKGVEKWPVFSFFSETASLSHKRNGKVTTGYLNNIQINDPIEGYKYTIRNDYSPLIGVDITTTFGVDLDFKLNQTEEVTLSTPTSGSTKSTEKMSVSATYNTDGGFRWPFKFWPFNGAYVRNSIGFTFRVSQTESTPKTYRKDLTGLETLTPGAFSNTFSVEPSISYKFSSSIKGSLFYKYNTTESSRIRKQTVNEFGFTLSMQIQN